MKKLAIVGTGIAGMGAAHFLKDDYDITLFEKNNYVGGHTNTVMVNDGVEDCPMDTGFMVFNNETYPNLVKLFRELDVPVKNTDMSFSVRNSGLNLEYNGSSLDGLFSQRKNIFNGQYLRMIREILKFNSHAPIMLEDPAYDDMTIKDYVQSLDLSYFFFTNFLVPMSSAVWSTPVDKMEEFPAKSLVRFFHNHGFVGYNTQLQWKTIEGGSKEYRKRLIEPFKGRIETCAGVEVAEQFDDHVAVTTADGTFKFDKVIIAAHADEALKMLKSPTRMQEDVLSRFSYQENIATVHTDESVMPLLRKNWSSWNFMMRDNNSYTVYYMNRLQGVSERKNFFVNINGEEYVDPEKIIQTITYHHPIFDVASARVQPLIDEMNNNGNLHFCGSYYRYGFHEDALLSSVNLCRRLLGREVLE